MAKRGVTIWQDFGRLRNEKRLLYLTLLPRPGRDSFQWICAGVDKKMLRAKPPVPSALVPPSWFPWTDQVYYASVSNEATYELASNISVARTHTLNTHTHAKTHTRWDTGGSPCLLKTPAGQCADFFLILKNITGKPWAWSLSIKTYAFARVLFKPNRRPSETVGYRAP